MKHFIDLFVIYLMILSASHKT